jgi:PIN domain nuclease of toxin-antitoxin system
MTYLLDTHTFLWAAIQTANLSAKANAIISDRSQEVQVSVVTFWEIGINYALGKLELQGVQPEQMPEVAEDLGLTICPLEAADAASVHLLPKTAHKDPFDRMLIWQCIRQRMTLLSADHDLKQYETSGLHLLW